MIIRKNTKAFKTILEIFTACRDRPDREQLIRLFITKAGDTVRERINVEGIQADPGLFYEMNYAAVLGNLKSSSHQLHQSDETPGLYFFHSSSNKVWDETPFEFDEAIKKEFGSLPDLPALRKKEKAAKFFFPGPTEKRESSPANKKGKQEKNGTGEKKGTSEMKQDKARKSARVVDLWPKQPDFKLKQEIQFTGLERITFRQNQLTKRDVLDYYNGIAIHLLPWLKDRPLIIRLYKDGQPGPAITDLESLEENSNEEVPDWIETVAAGKGKAKKQLLTCNDKEHLLFYVELGCLEFYTAHSRFRSFDSPDYLILTIGISDYEIEKTVEAALATKTILTGLQLPSFVKTDGISGLHIYIPLDSKGDFEETERAAEYLCKLVRLKVPELVTVTGLDDHGYGKVSLDYTLNEPNAGVIAPYSLVVPSAHVATPLLWDELNKELQMEEFTHKTISKRLKEKGDLFGKMFSKRINAAELLERLQKHYKFFF